MATLRVCVPDPTTNYVQNPAARFDTTGWNAFSSTLTRTLDYARFGIGSYKVVTNGSAIREGIYYRVNNLAGISEPITVSVYVRGSGIVHIRLIDNSGPAEWYSKDVYLNPNRWQRIEVTGRCSGGNDVRLYVETTNKVQTTTFYVDGAQMERKPYATTYCDGDQPGCRWNIIQHASLSTRNPYTRAGGRWVEVSGPDQPEKDIYMTQVGGMGAAPVTNQIQSFALAPGAFFNGIKIPERQITFTFHVKNPSKNVLRKTATLSSLHRLRQLLLDLLKPDRTNGNEEILFSYQDGSFQVCFKARYDGGLEGDWDVRNQFINSFPLRLLAVSPMFVEDDQEVAPINFSDSVQFNIMAGRIDGKWNYLNGGANTSGGDLEVGKDGRVYIAGSFNTINYSSDAINPYAPANRIAYWDGEKWNALSLSTNGAINDIAVAPNGDIYACGAFTTIGGVAANRIAKYVQSTGVWSALGTGLSGGDGVHISIAPNGDIYVGGSFTSAGGITANRIARWNGTWSAIGTYAGLNGNVNSMAITPDGSQIYVGGSFTDEFSLVGALLRISIYDVASNTFIAIGNGDGFNNSVLEVILSPDGIVHVCGSFTMSGTTPINRIAQLQGNIFIPLGSGMNADVNSIDVSANGELVACGSFTTAGGISIPRGLAIWNGSAWVSPDVKIGGGFTSPTVLAVQYSGNDLYISGNSFAGAAPGFKSNFSGITLVNNVGSAVSCPIIYILGYGKLKWIENQTTKKRIYLDLTILSGEEVFIDFGTGSIVSTVRGSLFYSILPGSDFGMFNLIPGENKLAVFMSDDVNAVMKLFYTPQHWSADATQQGDSF